MITPQKKSESIHAIHLDEKQIKMKITLEQKDSELVPEFSALSLKEEADSEDGEISTENNVSNIKEEDASSEDDEIDPSKLVRKGPWNKNKTNTSRAQNEPYKYPLQPSANQTTIIDGRQMAGSQVSETVWVEGDKNEIPTPVTEWSSFQTPTRLENHHQPSLNVLDLDDLDLGGFTAEDIRHVCAISNSLAINEDDILGCSVQNMTINETPCWVNVDEGFCDVQSTETFLGIQANIPEGCNGESAAQKNLSDWIGGEANCEDPNSPDSAYGGSIGREESPRSSPQSDFVMPQESSPRYQEHFATPRWALDFGSSLNQHDDVDDQYLHGLTIQVPLNIPDHEASSPQRPELLDISFPQNIPNYGPRSVDGCISNVPAVAEDMATPLPRISQIPQSRPPMNITLEPRHEKKKANHQTNQPKKNLPSLLPSGPCNIKTSSTKITDKTLEQRMASMLKPQQKEMLWKRTIMETDEKFCMKNQQGQTSLMELLLLDRQPNGRLLTGLLEAIYTRIERIISQRLADLLCHRDKFGHCVLYQAAIYKHNIPEIAAYIAETYASLGCDVNKPYKDGNTILHCLAQLGDDYSQVLDELLSVKVNGERIFRIDERNDAGNTPLHVAAEHHHSTTTASTLGIASTLVKHRCSVVVQNSIGATPLHVAAKSKSCQPEYFRKLLEQRGAENVQDMNGNTPLHLVAAAVNHKNVRNLKEVVGYLRTSNARLDIRNNEGRCPMDNVHPQFKEEIRKVF